MKFGSAEVARAKTLKAVGFPWRPRVGDWFIDHTGYCELVRTYEHAQRLGANGDVFLPSWDDCRHWLGQRGWSHPEVIHEEEYEITLLLTHRSGRTTRATGVSDLDCLYRIILSILLLDG